MGELLAEVRLRSRYRVYGDESRFYLGAHGIRPGSDAENVGELGLALGGQVLTVKQVLQLRETPRLDAGRWPPWGGHKGRFETQDWRITLVAKGRASVTKQSCEYVYEIRPELSSAVE